MSKPRASTPRATGCSPLAVGLTAVVTAAVVLLLSLQFRASGGSRAQANPDNIEVMKRIEDRFQQFERENRGEGRALRVPAGSELKELVGSLQTLTTSLNALVIEAPSKVAAAVAASLQGTHPSVDAVHADPPGAHDVERNVVLGLAKGIESNLLYRFVSSLRASTPGTTTDIVLFIDAADAAPGSDLEWVMDAFRVTVIKFEPDKFAEPRWRAYHPSSYRWMLIRDWMLEQPAGAYKRVLFTDVRDTIFQADPFVHVNEPGIYAFSEAKPRTIAQCGWNAGWVKDCFGAEGLAAVGGNVISCSGTSMGTWAAALAYAQLVGGEVAVNACERNGVDQGMHNYFLFSGRLRDALARVSAEGAEPLSQQQQQQGLFIVPNEDGWIATVQSMPGLQRDRVGRLVNNAGQPYAVVHQYDRSAALKEQYARQFVWVEPAEQRRK